MLSRASVGGQVRLLLDALRARRRGLSIGVLLFVAAAIAFRWARHAAKFWGMDDAGITYAAAFEVADHGSFAPYLEGTPLETYSNPLVFFVVVVLRFLGLFNPIATHIHLEMLLFAGMVVVVWATVRALVGESAGVIAAVVFCGIELLTPATWIWYGSGLETLWVAAGLVVLVWLCARTVRGVPLRARWGAVAFLVAITRPEAPLYVAAFYFAVAVLARPSELRLPDHLRQVARALAVTLALYALFLAWRRIAYHAWLPNTYYAKLPGHPQLARNLREYVLGGVLPYTHMALFTAAVFAVMLQRKTERLGHCLLVFLVATLALPITAGADWMGEHRFAVPFFAMSHLGFAVLAATCAMPLLQAPPRRWTRAAVMPVAAVLAVLVLLKFDGYTARAPLDLEPVTIGRVAEQRGAERWEHQMRLGLPYAVIMNPDVGGALLVGGMQLLDNGYLADFQMPRIRRNFAMPRDLAVLDQYQHAERRPDLVNDNNQFAIDHAVIGTSYFPGPDGLFARRDLFDVTAPDPDAALALDGGDVQVYVTSNTVRTAAPGALVRCEVIVAWHGATIPDYQTTVTGAVDRGDRDTLLLQLYRPRPDGMERRALLLGAPSAPGTYAVTLTLERPHSSPVTATAFTLEVTKDGAAIARAASALAGAGTPLDAAERVAWLREQQVPRMGMTAFRALLNRLTKDDLRHSARAGDDVLALRHNARLATLEDLPSSIRTSELTAIRRVVAACPAAGSDEAAATSRVLCLGRAIDVLRRYGYLGTLDRIPETARELSAARDHLGAWSDAGRYRALVGLTLADASDVGLQWQLLKLRRSLSRHELPHLPTYEDLAGIR